MYIHGAEKSKFDGMNLKSLKAVAVILTVILLTNQSLYSQEPVWINNADVREVKLYQNGAMVTRNGKATINAGLQEVVIDGLSPYINPQSITLKGTGDATILNVSFQQNYLRDKRKPKEITDLEEQLDSVTFRYQQAQNRVNGVNETITLLQTNKAVGGANNGVMADELEMVADYFEKKIISLRDELLVHQQKERKLKEQVDKLRAQLATLNQQKNLPVGNIIVSLSAKARSAISFDFSYVISSNASWSSFYDIRAKDVNSPVELVYKARVSQTTGENWENVKLKLNTGNPSEGGTKPELYPWYIALYQPQLYNRTADAQIELQSVPMSAGSTKAVTAKELQEVVIQVNENMLFTEFDIQLPYTVPSDGQAYQVDIQNYNVAGDYIYMSTPKLDADAFLMARLTGWESLNLTPGPANIYFDGAFVGETYINPAETNDTLNVSLGRDKRISIKRETIKDLSGNKIFGGNRERAYTFEITVKNSKKEAVKIIIEDQVPVTRDREIEVKNTEFNGGEYNAETGFVKWTLNLAAGETQKKRFSFTVKYPKDKQVNGL